MVESTAARREAEKNWGNNSAALRKIQPAVVELLDDVELAGEEWIFARDGSLTAMDSEGKWWGGCSVPLLAGESILKTLETVQTGSCLLVPVHAGLVRAARQRMGSWPVLFVVQPDLQIARMILSCHDFSDQIERHRFWMACGNDWSRQLRQLFDEHPGLATPTRFIRTKWTGDDVINPMITAAQDVFSAVLNERAGQLSSRQPSPKYSTDRCQVLLVGGSDFRLWDDAATVLHEQLSSCPKSDELTIHRFDTDDALCGSPLALLDAAAACGSIVSANLCRADCNQIVSSEVPWITWVTQPVVPAFETAGPRDALILADLNWRALATKAGWPADRLRVCGWPGRSLRHMQASKPELAIICDTREIEIPATVSGYSSHKLLWELIEEELHSDPLAVEKIEDYLTDRAGQLNIAVDALDRRSFIEGLILPAYQQGIARLLIAEKLPICLWGNGWPSLPEFAKQSRGSISSQKELESAISQSAGLIHCWPERAAHPIEAVGKPIVYRLGKDRQHLLRQSRHLLVAGALKTPASNKELGKTILQLIQPSRF